MEPLLKKLEKFQVEIGKHILCLSKSHADESPLLGLHWSRLGVHILLRKMTLLYKLLLSDGDELSSCIFRPLAAKNVYKISLVEQCLFLESEYGTTCTYIT